MTVGLLVAESIVAGLTAAPEPTLLTKVVAVILQAIIVAVLGYFAAVEVAGVYEEGRNWMSLARKAHGDPGVITQASLSFLRMIRHIILAVLTVAGVRARIRGLKIPAGAGGAGDTSAGTGGTADDAPSNVRSISDHPKYQPSSGTAPADAPKGYYGPGGAAPKLEPTTVPEIPPQAAPEPAPATAPTSGPATTPGEGTQLAPAAAAGAAAATSEEEKRPELVNAFGNAIRPRDPRPNVDIKPDKDNYVGPTDPPTGASCFGDVRFAPLTGHYHSVPKASVPSQPGLQIIADGRDVGGSHAPTHHTIYPAVRMLFRTFVDNFQALPWKHAGVKKGGK